MKLFIIHPSLQKSPSGFDIWSDKLIGFDSKQARDQYLAAHQNKKPKPYAITQDVAQSQYRDQLAFLRMFDPA